MSCKDKIKKGTDELKRQKELTQYSPDEICNHIMETELIPKSTEFSKRAEQILKEKFPSKEKVIQTVIATLMQDPVIKNILS